jgi:arylsulfatase A-like enzyme
MEKNGEKSSTAIGRRRFIKRASWGLLSSCVLPVEGLLPAVGEARGGGQTARPNILFIISDQHRFDWLGTSPHLPVRAPNLDKLGQRGIRFTQAACAAPVCAPSRACIASGKSYERTGVPSNAVDYPRNEPTFYSMLRDSGYWTVTCGKLDLNKPDRNTGVDGRLHLKEWGFSDGVNCLGKGDAVASGAVAPHDPYMAFLYRHRLTQAFIHDMRKRAGGKNPGAPSVTTYTSTWPTPLPDYAYEDNWIGQTGLDLMKKLPKDRPWFMQVNFAGPHNPMDVTRDMREGWRNIDFPPPNGSDGLTASQNNDIRRNYSAMVENIDRWVGIYVNEIEKRGELENTVVVYSSDHGEMLGDHDLFGKNVPYQPSLCVPLICAGPGIKRGVVCDDVVTTLDLPATFLDYGGVPRPSNMDSLTLRPVLQGELRKNRVDISSGLYSWRLTFDGRYKLIRGFDPATRAMKHTRRYLSVPASPILLFDLVADPLENLNLAHGWS